MYFTLFLSIVPFFSFVLPLNKKNMKKYMAEMIGTIGPRPYGMRGVQ